MSRLLSKTKKKTEQEINTDIKPVRGNWTRHAEVQRKHYKGDILQPFTAKGHVNPHFVSRWGAGLYGKEFGRKDITDYYLKRGTPMQRKATRQSLATGKMKPSQYLGFDRPKK